MVDWSESWPHACIRWIDYENGIDLFSWWCLSQSSMYTHYTPCTTTATIQCMHLYMYVNGLVGIEKTPPQCCLQVMTTMFSREVFALYSGWQKLQWMSTMSVSYAIALVYEEKVVQRVYIWTILGTSRKRIQYHQIEALKLANADLHGLVFHAMQLHGWHPILIHFYLK